LPKPNTNGKSYGYSYSDAGKPDANGYSYGDYNTTSIGYTYRDGNGDNTSGFAYAEPDPASANTKASAHAVSSADAPIRVVKVKKLQSNRELARQLASSLLYGKCQR
jgi:hypothetical protein